MLGRHRSPVALANEQVSIFTACRLVGLDLPEDAGYGRPIKIHCPFGDLSHIDGGVEAAFRVYPESNSAFCFAGCGYFTPVWLVAHAWDLDTTTAAQDLLERAGIRPPTLAAAWAQASTADVVPDPALLREALTTFCRRVRPDFDELQFTPAVASWLTRCLVLLDRVATNADAQTWLTGCKQAMNAVLSSWPPLR